MEGGKEGWLAGWMVELQGVPDNRENAQRCSPFGAGSICEPCYLGSARVATNRSSASQPLSSQVGMGERLEVGLQRPQGAQTSAAHVVRVEREARARFAPQRTRQGLPPRRTTSTASNRPQSLGSRLLIAKQTGLLRGVPTCPLVCLRFFQPRPPCSTLDLLSKLDVLSKRCDVALRFSSAEVEVPLLGDRLALGDWLVRHEAPLEDSNSSS